MLGRGDRNGNGLADVNRGPHVTIEDVQARIVRLKTTQAVTTPVGRFDERYCVVVAVECGGGLVGSYYGFKYSLHEAEAMCSYVHYLGERLVGRNVVAHRNNWRMMVDSLVFTGGSGIGLAAVAVLDVCLWDVWGKCIDASLWQIVGNQKRPRVPCYSSGLFLSSAMDDIVSEATRAVESGFDFVKLRVGGQDIAGQIQRVSGVRDAIGAERGLLLDAVMAWDVIGALTFTKAVYPYNIYWLEDPVDYKEGWALSRLRDVVRRSSIRVVGGEFLSGLLAYLRAIEAGSVETLVIDLQRVGGITPWIYVAELAIARGITVVGHVFPEVSVHLHDLAAFPGCPMEYSAWSQALYDDWLVLEEGYCRPPNAPGLGVSPSWERL